MNKFAQMTTEQFCDYVASNPGGARKAFALRKKDNPDCTNQEIVYRDRTIYKERERINIQYVEKEVIKEVIKEITIYESPVIHWFKTTLNKIEDTLLGTTEEGDWE